MRHLLFSLIGCLFLVSCDNQKANSDYLVRIHNMDRDEYGYLNLNGDTIIPLGKYPICFTDTLKTYAIVTSPEKGEGFICIDQNEKIKYQVFPFDNGPDYPSEGVFRIIESGKIGYADAITGEITIKPQFECAFPFKDGVAKVAYSCKEVPVGEYHEWISENWFYVDKTGKRVNGKKD